MFRGFFFIVTRLTNSYDVLLKIIYCAWRVKIYKYTIWLNLDPLGIKAPQVRRPCLDFSGTGVGWTPYF
jgi:hypothetical protein